MTIEPENPGSNDQLIERQNLISAAIRNRSRTRAHDAISTFLDNKEQVANLVNNLMRGLLPITGLDSYEIEDLGDDLSEIKNELTEHLRNPEVVRALVANSIDDDQQQLSRSHGALIGLKVQLKAQGVEAAVLDQIDALIEKSEVLRKDDDKINCTLVEMALRNGLEYALSDQAWQAANRQHFSNREQYIEYQMGMARKKANFCTELIGILSLLKDNDLTLSELPVEKIKTAIGENIQLIAQPIANHFADLIYS